MQSGSRAGFQHRRCSPAWRGGGGSPATSPPPPRSSFATRIRSGLPPTTGFRRPTGARSKRTPPPDSGRSSGSTEGWTRSRRRSPRGNLRGGGCARLRRCRPGRPVGAARPGGAGQFPPNPSDGLRDYGIAALDFKRIGGGLLVETLDHTAIDRGQAARGHPTPADARGADRPHVRLAGRGPCPLERDRAVPGPPDGRHRRRPGKSPGGGGGGAPARRRPGEAGRDGLGRLSLPRTRSPSSSVWMSGMPASSMAESWREKAGSSFCLIFFAPTTRSEEPIFCSRTGFSAAGLEEGIFCSGG